MTQFEESGAKHLVWAQSNAHEDSALLTAFTTLAENLRTWGVPGSTNRGMFSTWGEQWVLLDGFVVERSEPEKDYDTPIDGFIAAGALVVQLLHRQAGLKEPRWAEGPGKRSLSDLHSVLAWQLETKRPLLDARLPQLVHLQEVGEAKKVAAAFMANCAELLPDESTSLTYGLVTAQPRQPNDVTDLFVRFEERLPLAPLRTLTVSTDGTVHRSAYSKCAEPFAEQQVLDRAELREVADRLCDECYPGLRSFISSVARAKPSAAPGRQLTYVSGRLHGTSMTFAHIVRYAVRPWDVVSEPTTMSATGVRSARDGQVLQTAIVPAHIASLIEEMLRRFERSNAPVALVLD